MSVETDASAAESRINSIFSAIDGPQAAPQISSYQGSPTFQALVQQQRNQSITDGTYQNDATPQNQPPEGLKAIMQDASSRTGVELPLIEAIAKNESGFNPNATSPVGAQGLMQLMPGTAAGLGVSDSYDASQNVNGGAKYLQGLMSEFGGDLTKVIAAYNAGPGAVQKYGGVPPYAETRNYVQNVLASYEKYRAQEAMTVNAKGSAAPTG